MCCRCNTSDTVWLFKAAGQREWQGPELLANVEKQYPHGEQRPRLDHAGVVHQINQSLHAACSKVQIFFTRWHVDLDHK